MSITSNTKKENCIVELEIAVDAQRLREATDKAFRNRAKTITVPGFRKGKAPRQIIESMYGDSMFVEDAVNELYPQAYSEALEEAEIQPVDKADVEILTLDKETGFTFKATVTVKPEVEVGDYKGLVAEKTIYTAKEEAVDSEIDRMRERGARIVTVEEREARIGDTAVIDFEGFLDGVPFEGGKGENHNLELGSHTFIDTFEDQIAGHMPGDQFDVNVTFPEEYQAEELKGKPAVFKVTLNEIKEKQLPDADDEFAKDVSEFDTIAELRADLLSRMQEALNQRAQDELETALLDQVIAGMTGFVPEVMFENRINDMMRDFEYRLSSQGMSLDLYMQYSGMDAATFRQSFRPGAERQVKMRLALEAVAAKEGFTVTEEEITAEIAKLSEGSGIELEQMRTFVNEKNVIEDIGCTKALDLIRDSALVTEVAEGDRSPTQPENTGESQQPADEPENAE